jgi:hypothetical protein
MALCFVFTPARPKLYTLNTSAWLVLTMCDGRSGRALINGYKRAFGARLVRGQAISEVRSAIQSLADKGMVLCHQGPEGQEES